MKNIFILILFLSSFQSVAQKLPLFDYPERMKLVGQGGDYIYNNEYDKADSVIVEVEKVLPGHPIVHLMKALNIAWHEMPVHTSSEVFPAHYEELQKVIESAELLQEVTEDHLEGVFFEMSARGLLTEYYATEGTYLKALGEARKMYSLAKTGFDLVNENPEFLFYTGLYNYFREMYPNRHPIYKPFMWFFKTGNIQDGLMQLDSATRVGKLTKIEAHLYLAYIYLRYEDKPLKARYYLENLVDEYPNNNYFKSKLIECLVVKFDYGRALPLIQTLQKNKDPYYKMCGEVYYGLYQEKFLKNISLSEQYYNKSLVTGRHYVNKGLYYRSLAFIGLGRINMERGKNEIAKEYLEQVLEIDESETLNKEAKTMIKSLK